MSKVWVANFSGHDYSDAESYGELKFITKGYLSLRYLDRVFFEVVSGSRETSPEDFFLLSGMNLVNLLAAIVWWSKHQHMKLLVWDKKQKVYRVFELTKEHLFFTVSQVASEDFDE